MEEENIISFDIKKIAIKTFQLSIFIAVAVAAPYFHNQLITGSIVNALLFISVSMLGIESALVLCIIPSLLSIYTGLLPIILAPMIPFIMAGNALMVLVFSLLTNPVKSASEAGGVPTGQFNRVNFWTGAILATFVKFIFIWVAGTILVSSVLSDASKNILLMISWPQFVTAIAGAGIAFLLLKIIKKI